MIFIKYLKIGWRWVHSFFCRNADIVKEKVATEIVAAPAKILNRIPKPPEPKPEPRILREVRGVATLLSDAVKRFSRGGHIVTVCRFLGLGIPSSTPAFGWALWTGFVGTLPTVATTWIAGVVGMTAIGVALDVFMHFAR